MNRKRTKGERVHIGNEMKSLKRLERYAKQYKREKKKHLKSGRNRQKPKDWQRHLLRHGLKEQSIKVEEAFFLSGIYYLVNSGYGIVYIGESGDIMKRISQHLSEGKKEFDRFTFEVYPNSTREERRVYEMEAIKKFKPVYNIEHNEVARNVLLNE
jgi:predicted GIY-YIG superfamily endonuclease